MSIASGGAHPLNSEFHSANVWPVSDSVPAEEQALVTSHDEGVGVGGLDPITAVSVDTGRAYEDYGKVLQPGVIYSSNDESIGSIVTYASQRVHTQTYLEEAYIEPGDLNEAGLYTQYADRSTYFYVVNPKREATVRQIACDRRGLLSLPTLHNFEIDAETLREVAGVARVADINPKSAVEISALASRPIEEGDKSKGDFQAVLQLYTRMLRNSLEQGHEYWLLNTYDALATRLHMLIGKDQMKVIGEPRDYLGSMTRPYLIKPQDVVRSILGSSDKKFDFHKAYLRNQFAGLNDRKVPADIRELLAANEIPTTDTSPIDRLIHSKKAWAMTALGAYCTARAIPFGEIDQFEGSVPMLWAIDIGTVPTYVKGLEMSAVGKTVGARAVGFGLASASFAAPYAYAYAEGNDYPPTVNLAIATFAGVCAVKEVATQIWQRRSERHLVAGLRQLNQDEE